MTEVSPNASQLDRIEAGLRDLRTDIAQLGERLARIEERHTGLSSRLDMHGATLERHAERLGEIEKSIVRTDQSTGRLNGRWAALGAVTLVLLSAVGGFLSRLIAP